MHAVGGVAVQVGQVDVQRLVEVAQRRVVVADLGRDDRLHARRQRGVAGGDRVVVLEVGALLLVGELVALEEQREHHVGLLEHLEAVDHQRVEVQQQRAQLGRGLRQVPDLAVEEEVVLRVDAEAVVEADGHARGALAPLLDLVAAEVQPARIRSNSTGSASRTVARPASTACSRLNRAITLVNRLLLTTVVYSSGPVTPWMWKLGSPLLRQKPRSAHIRAASTRMSTPSRTRKPAVAGRADVLHQRVGDVGVDVVLRGAGRVVGRRLLAVDRAPREHRAALVHLAAPGRAAGQHPSGGSAERCAPPRAA